MTCTRPRRAPTPRTRWLAPLLLLAAAGLVTITGCSGSTTSTGGSSGSGAARGNGTASGATDARPGTSAATSGAPADAGGAVRADVPVLTVGVHEGNTLTFDAPDTVTAGWVEIDLVNNGTLAHQASLGRVPDGAPLDVAEQTMANDPVTGIGSLQEAGGANTVVGGATGKAIISLTPGTYYLYCMVPDLSDQEPHARHGMVRKLVVTAPTNTGSAASATPVRAVAGSIALKDYGFVMPEPFAGRGWYEVTNDGPQPHELTLIALASGRQAEEVKQYFVDVAGGPLSTPTVSTPPAGPKPYADVGGLSSVGTGTKSYVWLDLSAGDYVAMCYVPDVPAPGRTGTPDFRAHFVHDMWQPFTIA